MKIKIIALGKNRTGAMRDLYDDYMKRLSWKIDLVEIDPPRAATSEQEAVLIKKHLPDNYLVVALDERGQELSSPDFAHKIEKWRDTGQNLCFLIGGADGFTAEIRQRADFLLSFGKQTWPHMLVRVMLAEQLYRAQQILAGHPYHRA